MSKAEERALEAYPVITHTLIPMNDDTPEIEQDCNEFYRQAYIEGYQQEEKDFALICLDISDIIEIHEDVIEMESYKNIYRSIKPIQQTERKVI